jgi:hypothetical protein
MRRMDDMDTGDLLKHVRTLSLTALFVVLAVTAVQGRVFLRWDGRSDVIGSLTRLGGSLAYETQVRINGGDGKLTVVSFDDALDDIAPRIRRILSIPTPEADDTNGSLHLLRGESTTIRLLMLRIEDAGRTLAIAIEQSNAEYAASETELHSHELKALPPYPGSKPLFFAEDADTKLRVAVSETLAHADSVQLFYDRELRSKGWIPSLPDSSDAQRPMPLYIRKSELCCIAVTPTQTSALQRITLLHKELGNRDRLE